MAGYDNNPDAPYRSNAKTGSAKKPKSKPKTGGGTTAPKGPLYDWNDGHGRVHTIPAGVHRQNVDAQRYGIDLSAPLAAPIDTRTAYGMAEAAAGRAYDPQIQAAQGIEQSLPSWYQGYVDTVTSAQNASNAYAQPLLNQAQGWANQAPQAAPGLDPGSAAYGQSQQAAQSGQGLAQLGASVLAAIPTAANAYFSGLQTTAAKDLPQAQAYYGKQVGDLKAQRGQATVDEFGKLRTNEQNYGLAAETLGLNTAKSAADIDLQRGIDPVTKKPLPTDPEKAVTSGPFAGLTSSQISGLSSKDRQSYIDSYNSAVHPPKTPKDPNALTPAQQRAAAAKKAKHKGDVQAATGKVRNKVTDIIGVWDGGGTVDDTSKAADPVTGKYPQRKATPAELRDVLIHKYGYLARIALAVREGRPLDQKAQDYLHGLDKNLRIPREWIQGSSASRPKPKTPAEAVPGIGGAVQQATTPDQAGGNRANTASVSEILAHPGNYTPLQREVAKALRRNGSSPSLRIQPNGSLG